MKNFDHLPKCRRENKAAGWPGGAHAGRGRVWGVAAGYWRQHCVMGYPAGVSQPLRGQPFVVFLPPLVWPPSAPPSKCSGPQAWRRAFVTPFGQVSCWARSHIGGLADRAPPVLREALPLVVACGCSGVAVVWKQCRGSVAALK